MLFRLPSQGGSGRGLSTWGSAACPPKEGIDLRVSGLSLMVGCPSRAVRAALGHRAASVALRGATYFSAPAPGGALATHRIPVAVCGHRAGEDTYFGDLILTWPPVPQSVASRLATMPCRCELASMTSTALANAPSQGRCGRRASSFEDSLRDPGRSRSLPASTGRGSSHRDDGRPRARR